MEMFEIAVFLGPQHAVRSQRYLPSIGSVRISGNYALVIRIGSKIIDYMENNDQYIDGVKFEKIIRIGFFCR